MGHRWRNVLIGIVILAAIAGAIWKATDPGEDTEKAATDHSEQGKAGVAKEEKSGETRKTGATREVRSEEGFQAPDFTLNTLEGKKVTLSKNGGSPLWSTCGRLGVRRARWRCPTCRKPMKSMAIR